MKNKLCSNTKLIILKPNLSRKILMLSTYRTANGIVAEALRLATVVANDRLAGKGGSGGSSGGSGGRKKGNPADVIELTSSIFNKEVSCKSKAEIESFYRAIFRSN